MGDELVHQARRRGTRTGDDPGADAVRVDRGGCQAGDRILIKIARHGDAGVDRAERVELLAHLGGLDAQVTGIEPDSAELGAGDLDGGLERLVDVIGVEQQDRIRAQRPHLGFEGLAFGVMDEGEGVRGSADSRQPVAAPGLQVRRRGEPCDHGRPGSGDGRLLMRAP